MLTEGNGDIFGFGRPFISNPDLPERIKHEWLLNEVDPTSMYSGINKGYTDYRVYVK